MKLPNPNAQSCTQYTQLLMPSKFSTRCCLCKEKVRVSFQSAFATKIASRLQSFCSHTSSTSRCMRALCASRPLSRFAFQHTCQQIPLYKNNLEVRNHERKVGGWVPFLLYTMHILGLAITCYCAMGEMFHHVNFVITYFFYLQAGK